MEQYLFEYKVKYIKDYYNGNYDESYPDEFETHIISRSDIRLVKADSFIEAYMKMEDEVKYIHSLNNNDRFDISIISLNI